MNISLFRRLEALQRFISAPVYRNKIFRQFRLRNLPRPVKIQSKSTESGFSRQKFILEGLKIITVTKYANKYEYLSMKCKYLTIYSLVIFAAEVQVT